MFFINKKREVTDKPIEVEVVKCGDCGCMLQKDDAQNVEWTFGPLYFCGKCKKPYTRIKYDVLNDGPTYYKEVEVTEKGTVIDNKNR